MDITLLIPSAGPHCKPLECGQGGVVFIHLKPGNEMKTADGSGILVGTIAQVQLICSNAGSGQWAYTFTVSDSEIAAGQSVDPSHVAEVCCLRCDTRALFAKLRRAEALSPMLESFLVFDEETPVEVGQFKLFRMHGSIFLRAMEVSVGRIDSEDGPYPEAPGKLFVKPLATPEQALGPWIELATGATVDTASSFPMTARFEFSPPLMLEGGRAFGVGVDFEQEGVFHGLEVHLEFSLTEQP